MFLLAVRPIQDDVFEVHAHGDLTCGGQPVSFETEQPFYPGKKLAQDTGEIKLHAGQDFSLLELVGIDKCQPELFIIHLT